MNDALTIGDWATEAESAVALDAALDRINLWKVYPEVWGTLSHVRPGQHTHAIRIDRILVPNSDLIARGWTGGIVGIEIKRSGEKIGPPIAQAMDYSRAVWKLPPADIKVWLDWVFIWPMDRQGSVVGSILCQNRIGAAYANSWTLLHLKSGEQNVIKVEASGLVQIGTTLNGYKVGSR